MKKVLKITTLILCLCLMACSISGCGDTPEEEVVTNPEPSHTVVIKVKNYGDITLDLYADYAPQTVENFVKLANEGFYDNTIFHRISKGFMIQGGGFSADNPDEQKKTETIPGEFINNGFAQNKIRHNRGVISMARTNEPNSASSQFFICDGVAENLAHLNGDYAAFGVVTEGMDVVDLIASCEVVENPSMMGEMSLPVEYPVIETIIVK